MFALPSDSHVSLEVYDVLGNHVTTVAEGQYPAGSHGIQLDASRLGSGTYFYRIITDNGTATKRMLVTE
jgi:flagellar hook assembly protein FlgD